MTIFSNCEPQRMLLTAVVDRIFSNHMIANSMEHFFLCCYDAMIDRRMLQHGDHRPHVYMLLQIMRSLTLHALQIMLRRGDHGPLAGGDHGPLYFLHAYRVRQVISEAHDQTTD